MVAMAVSFRRVSGYAHEARKADYALAASGISMRIDALNPVSGSKRQSLGRPDDHYF
jgi:hypothetical protein